MALRPEWPFEVFDESVNVAEKAFAARVIRLAAFPFGAPAFFAFDFTTFATTFETTGTAIVAPRSIRIEWQRGFVPAFVGCRQSRMTCPTKLAGTVSVNIGTFGEVAPLAAGHFIPTPGV